MKVQGSSKIIKITKGNQGIVGDIFCKYFKKEIVNGAPQWKSMQGRSSWIKVNWGPLSASIFL